MKIDFEQFFSQLKETNATFDFYTDFKTVIKNIFIYIIISINLFILKK